MWKSVLDLCDNLHLPNKDMVDKFHKMILSTLPPLSIPKDKLCKNPSFQFPLLYFCNFGPKKPTNLETLSLLVVAKEWHMKVAFFHVNVVFNVPNSLARHASSFEAC